MTNFERLIAALDREYEIRNEGYVGWHLEVERMGQVWLWVYDSLTKMQDGDYRYCAHVGPLASHESPATALDSCAAAILRQMGVTSE